MIADLATLECTPRGLKLVDMVEGLDHAQLEQLVGLPINRSQVMERMARGPSLLGIDTRKDLGGRPHP